MDRRVFSRGAQWEGSYFETSSKPECCKVAGRFEGDVDEVDWRWRWKCDGGGGGVKLKKWVVNGVAESAPGMKDWSLQVTGVFFRLYFGVRRHA